MNTADIDPLLHPLKDLLPVPIDGIGVKAHHSGSLKEERVIGVLRALTAVKAVKALGFLEEKARSYMLNT